MWLVILGIFTAVAYFLFITKSELHTKLGSIPGPPTVPIFGNALELLNPEEWMVVVTRWCNQYGPRVKTKLGMQYHIYLSGAEDLEKIFSSRKNLEKGEDMNIMKSWLGNGLITSHGEDWAKQRKMLNPAFHTKVVEGSLDIFNNQSFKMIRNLGKEAAGGKVLDISRFLKYCSLDIICEAAMRVEINAQDNLESPYLKAVLRINELIEIRTARPWLTPEFIWRRSCYGAEEMAVLKIAHGFTEKVILQRKMECVRENKKKIEDITEQGEYIGERKRMAFLDLLLEAQLDPKNCLTDIDIRQQVDTIMFGGHDTTASNAGFTLFLLGNYPEIQGKVYEELFGIFGNDRHRPVTTADISEMKYLQSCIKESLRIYPTVPIVSRFLRTDLALGDGVVIPAGVTVMSNIFQLHRDASNFPNPEEFNPSRFFREENDSKLHPYAYVPFLAGPRACIGQKFAMMEEKVVLANILRNFKVTSQEKMEDLVLLVNNVLDTKNGLRISLERRN